MRTVVLSPDLELRVIREGTGPEAAIDVRLHRLDHSVADRGAFLPQGGVRLSPAAARQLSFALQGELADLARAACTPAAAARARLLGGDAVVRP